MSTSKKDIAFVRTGIIPQQEPPAGETGIVHWVRENLLSSWLNVFLTLLGVGAVYYVAAHVGPWMAHTVWNANSLAECREVIVATWGEDATGACWALVRERWSQYLFGFYTGAYWRPVLTFVLMFVALAPVLFQNLPRKMLWFSVAYPALAYFLLVGGSVFGPILFMAGFALAVVAYRLAAPQGGLIVATIVAVLVPVLWWILVVGPLSRLLGDALPALGLEFARTDRFGGFLLSIVIGVTGISLSLPLGIVLALGRRSDMILVRGLCVGFIEVIRGVPLITLLFFASLLLQYFLPKGTNFDVIVRVIIMVTLFSAAYIAEVIRGGLVALPRGQYEAADALGLDYWQAHRLIILPQALKISIPGIVSSFIGLFKDTTLVIFVGLLDPLKGITDAVRSTAEWNGVYWEPYVFVGTLFFILCFGMSRYSMYLERLLQREHR